MLSDSITIRLGTDGERENLFSCYPIAKKVISDGGYFIVARLGDRTVGFLWAFKRDIPAPVERSELFINVVDVIDEGLRCQGIASMMVAELIRIAEEEKVYQVRAYCDIRNIPSHRLWLKNRFSISPVPMPDGSVAGSFVSYVL